SPLTISFGNNATPAAAQALIRSITYQDTSFPGRKARLYVRFTLTDDTGLTAHQIAYITPSGVNRSPFASAGGPYNHVEGYNLVLDASATIDLENDPLTYSWDVNGDGIFGDASGVNPTLTPSQLNALGLNDGPQTITNARVRV